MKVHLSHSLPLLKGTDLHCETGSKLMLVVYKGIAPADERKSLPSLDITSKRLADGLLQLAFAFGVQVRLTMLVLILVF